MSQPTLRNRMRRGDTLAGTFLKTPSFQLIEILAKSGMDFVALDAEHAPFGRNDIDACMAVGRALNFPVLVRIPDGNAAEILKVLDCGAAGVIVPHVASVEKAAQIDKWARFGHGGRGYAGSSRWAGYTTRSMPELLDQSANETIVIAQIEEPEGVDAAEGIAAVDGVDGLFVGPADLSVCLGVTDTGAPEIMEAMKRVGDACRVNGKTAMTFVSCASQAAGLKERGLTMFFVASEQSFVLNAARDAANDLRAL